MGAAWSPASQDCCSGGVWAPFLRERPPGSRPSAKEASAGGLSPLEQAVAEVWCRVLGLPNGSIRDASQVSFVELGGESLLALRAAAGTRHLLCSDGDDSDSSEESPEPSGVSESPLRKAVAPQFGHLAGAFAVPALLVAPSLAAYCERLQSFGYQAPLATSDAHDASAAASGNSSEEQGWPAVRAACCSRDAGAAAKLAALLDAAAPREAALWCGAGPRAVGSGGSGGGSNNNNNYSNNNDQGSGNRSSSSAAAAGRFTALHAAARAGAVECVQLLLQRKARVTVTEGGAAMTPLHYAAMGSSSECLQLLLQAKAPLTVRDARGQSLIHAAARTGATQCLCLLLERLAQGNGGNVRALKSSEGTRGLLEWTDRWARSAVHWATLNGHAEALRLLLAAKASAAPRPITAHQMAKRTHLTQEQPLTLALRVHGPSSEVTQLLRDATAEMEESAVSQKAAAVIADFAGDSEYVLTLSQGTLDRLALWELRERLSEKTSAVQRVQCRIFFRSSSSPASLAALKSAEKVCAVVLRADGAELAEAVQEAAASQGGSCEAAIAKWISEVTRWPAVVDLWWKFSGCLSDAEAADKGAAREPLTFKITCRRSGTRFAKVSTQSLAVAAATAIGAARGWRPQVRRPDLEVRILISDSDLLVDVPLLVQGSVRTGGGQLVSAGMAAPVAWALARSAELRAGERVLDPMCGKAVILVEAALSIQPCCHFLGFDLDTEQLAGARSNAKLALASGARMDLLQGDACHLPLPDGSVDAIICDIPFGRQHGTIEECRGGLYKALLLEFDRVVTREKSGRMVLISSLEQEPWVLEAAGLGQPLTEAIPKSGASPSDLKVRWTCKARRELKLGFLDAVILVLRRPDEADGKGGPVLPAKSNRLWWETTAGRGDWADLK
ncbi:unnamed protein product, partial [Polarella glacialis]